MKKLGCKSRSLSLLISSCLLLAACGNTAGKQNGAEQLWMKAVPEFAIEEVLDKIPFPAAMIQAMPTPAPTPTQEPEERTDHTQDNTEKFYEIAKGDYGLSQKQAQDWFVKAMEDDIFNGGVRELSGLLFDDIDGNGKTDMVIMVNEFVSWVEHGTGALYFYMNQDKGYCFQDENFPYFGIDGQDMCWADLDGDGCVEIAFGLEGTGNGGSGDWYQAILRYTGNDMERLEIPSEYEDETEIYVNVIMEPEKDTYSAYCPYLNETITFQASNAWDDPDFSQMPRSVGHECRGFYDPQIVTYEGRKAIQYSEYLYGEGGIAHGVGRANFILVWDKDGNGSVADWWVEGWLRNGG